MLKVLVLFYSKTGNVAKLAEAVAEGAKSVEDVEVSLKQVPGSEISGIPTATNQDLAEANGIAFGSPTRYGNMHHKMKEFIDGTGELWAKGALENKVAGVFTSTGTLHGGQESTILTMMVPLFHFGMIILGVPYSEKRLFSLEVGGGSPYGPSSVSGPNAARVPTENDLGIARTLGKRIAETAKKLHG